MNSKNKSLLFKSLFLAAALLGSSATFADDDDHKNDTGIVPVDCSVTPYLHLVLNLDPFAEPVGTEFGAGGWGYTNDTICVDIPVALKKAKVVFNIDNSVAGGGVDGNGNINGLKHMAMLGTMVKARIAAGLMEADDVSIIGVMHGGAIGAAYYYASPTPQQIQQQKWIEMIWGLKQAGVNIQLEVCGVTMRGQNKTRADLYVGSGNGKIYINQGAVGRIIYLEQQKYVYMHEG